MNEPASTSLERASWRVFFVATAILFYWIVVRLLLAPVVLAILVTVIFAPLHRRLAARLGTGRARAATASMAAIGLGVGAPAVGIALLFIAQTRALLKELLGEQEVRSRLVGFLVDGTEWLAFHARTLTGAEIDPTSLADQATRQIGGALSTLLPDALGQTGALLLGFVVFQIVLFYLLWRGHELLALAVDLAPIATAHSTLILRRLQRTIQGVFLGGLLTAVVQGLVGGLGFWLAGFANFVIWGMLISIASFIPIVGTSLIWAPVVLSLWLTGHDSQALGVLAVGLVISTVDNLVRALFIHHRSDVHPLLILFSIVGALRTTGLMGIVYGPLLAACLTEAVRIYRVEFTDRRPWGGLRNNAEPRAEEPTPVDPSPADPQTPSGSTKSPAALP